MALHRNVVVTSVLLAFTLRIIAKKPAIDSTVYGKWPTPCNTAISNNGKYCIYTICGQPLNSYTAVVESTGKKWRLTYHKALRLQMIPNSQRYYVQFKDSESIVVGVLGADSVKYFSGVANILPEKRGLDEKLVLCRKKQFPETLYILDVQMGIEKAIPRIVNCKVNKDNNVLLLQINNPAGYQHPLAKQSQGSVINLSA